MPGLNSDDFYALARLPLGALVSDRERPELVGTLVRRTTRTWVARDTKPPLVRWHGRIDAEPIPWSRLIRADQPGRPSTET